ncbi:MAG: rdd family [Verrucomicrobiales bacterium]|nr:rdd family [Verrucomicrobiales bacterium]
MEIYVLKDGARRGPFLPFKLRELLEDKEFLPSDPGWMEGMEAWAPLSSIEALEHWMPRDSSRPPRLPSPEEWEEHIASQEKSAPLPETPSPPSADANRRSHAWLRWLARIVDGIWWFLLVWTVAVASGYLGIWHVIFAGYFLLIGTAVAWIPVESFLLHRFATTPGKWLLGIRVTDDVGQPLGFFPAMKRSLLVLVTGRGFGLPVGELIPVLQFSMSWILYRRIGTTLWDRAAASQVAHSPVGIAGIAISLATLVGWAGLVLWIIAAAPLPVDLPSDQRARIEEVRRNITMQMQMMQPAPSPGVTPPPA